MRADEAHGLGGNLVHEITAGRIPRRHEVRQHHVVRQRLETAQKLGLRA